MSGVPSKIGIVDPKGADLMPPKMPLLQGKPFPVYPGGKNGDGDFQFIINRIPSHSIYVEPFLGNGAIMRKKRLASYSRLNDIDPTVFHAWRKFLNNSDEWLEANIPVLPYSQFASKKGGYSICLNCKNALEEIQDVLYYAKYNTPDTFIYLDPPYPKETRQTKITYEYEFNTYAQHIELLDLITDPAFKARIMISSYFSSLYTQRLKGWNYAIYESRTRGKTKTEYLFMNYDPSTVKLHDYRYLGEDAKAREIKNNQVARWLKRLKNMDSRMREKMIQAIKDSYP
ncbi:MAG: hypothetical protein AAF388_02515 [Bacteroidota bacterium]